MEANWGRKLDGEEEWWRETPEYFHDVVWPEYRRIVEEIKTQQTGIKYLDSGNTSVEQLVSCVLSCVIHQLHSQLGGREELGT